MKHKYQNILLSLAATLAVVTSMPSPAHAAGSGMEPHLRFGFYVGPWRSYFQQEGFGQVVSLPSPISLGVNMPIGMGVGPFYLEYNLSYFFSGLFSTKQSDQRYDARYYSPFGLNLGFDIPHFPLEVFIGYEWGVYNFAYGTEAAFPGKILKLGAALPIGKKFRFVLRGEWRRHFISGDFAGYFPAGISAKSDTVWLGVGIGVGNED